MTRSQVFFGLIPPRQLSYPSHVDRRRATRVQKTMDNDSQKSRHGDNQSRRHISRFHSGFFFRHPLMLKFNYYWRVEPGIQYYCDVDYDPFVFMEENKKVYSFSVSLMEYQSTIPSLWKTVQGFVRANPDLLAANSSIDFLLKDPSQGIESDYNLCHFWSNFEVGDMRFWRSTTYAKFFAHLDRAGGIYYERWAEGPIHSIAAALFLRREQIHQWDDIGYFQTPFSHCPSDYERFHSNGKCFCDPFENFDQDPYSCAPLWWELDRSVTSHSSLIAGLNHSLYTNINQFIM
ncbi:alpha 1,2-mannosyltransferase 2.4.1, variant 2 [Puccinia graminis f. sp. tritici]|uniref:Alpha 1,2-mannosyltransferase 2.4.1, variant 2 n=2 Tax=Puccinia graminis f. sp. tritici TaxID=56615 RepID=A0A5B0LL16_PUCGR|nr:alpha 1,2-mannosyltransferase 2.4.1, variant 2 [Puccinia graminis f. sp. tritici]